jgi:hypothetical protein
LAATWAGTNGDSVRARRAAFVVIMFVSIKATPFRRLFAG